MTVRLFNWLALGLAAAFAMAAFAMAPFGEARAASQMLPYHADRIVPRRLETRG